MTVSRPGKLRSRRVRSWRPPTSMPTSSPSSGSRSHDCSSTARRPPPTRGRPSIWSPRRASGNPEPMDNFVTPRASSAPAPGALEPLLCLRGIGKSYAAPVLQDVDVDLDLLPGEVHQPPARGSPADRRQDHCSAGRAAGRDPARPPARPRRGRSPDGRDQSRERAAPACQTIRSGLAPCRASLPWRAGPRGELRAPPGRDPGRLRAGGLGTDRAPPRDLRSRSGRFRSRLSRRLGSTATVSPSSPGDSRRYWHKTLYLPMPAIKVLVPTAETSPQTWSYTTKAADTGWINPEFDDSTWSRGESGFGTKGTPGALVHTDWKSSDIWLRARSSSIRIRSTLRNS